MSLIIPTIRIKSDNEEGFVVINKCDFDELEHELYDDKPVETKSRSTVKKSSSRKKA